MSEIAAINVLLLSSQLDAAGRWAGMLPPPQFQTVGGPLKKGDGPHGKRSPRVCHLGVRSQSPFSARRHRCRPGRVSQSDPDAGVIRIAAEGPADVALAADFTPRELQLACELLAQVTRLRRHMHGPPSDSTSYPSPH